MTEHKINEPVNYITIADRVLNGEFGNCVERKKKLEAAGYNYEAVQTIVNEKISKISPLYIKDVKFNGPATIVFWIDGTKTVVKCSENDVFDQEKGLAMAMIKKMSGNVNSYHKIFKKWCKEDEEEGTIFSYTLLEETFEKLFKGGFKERDEE